jgi:hypothetical protein
MKSLLFMLIKSHNLVFPGLLIFYKNKQTRQIKETKQNNNKVKRLEVRDSPCRNHISPRQWRQKTVLMSHRTRWETPRGRYDKHISKFSLSIKPKSNRPVGERNHFWRLLLADFDRAYYRCQQQCRTCTQHSQTTLPQLTVRLSISLVLLKTKD